MSNESISPSAAVLPQLEVIDDEKFKRLTKPVHDTAQTIAPPHGELTHEIVTDKPEGITYTRADGTVETALDPTDAIRRCPVLGKMPLEQAKVLLELQAMDTKTTNPEQKPSEDKQDAVKSNQSFNIGNIQAKRVPEKTPNISEAVKHDKSATSLMQANQAVSSEVTEPAEPAKKSHTVSETVAHNLQDPTPVPQDKLPQNVSQLEMPNKIKPSPKEINPKLPSDTAIAESAAGNIASRANPNDTDQNMQYIKVAHEAAENVTVLNQYDINQPESVTYELQNKLIPEVKTGIVLNLDRAIVPDTENTADLQYDVSGGKSDSSKLVNEPGDIEMVVNTLGNSEPEPEDLSEDNNSESPWRTDDKSNREAKTAAIKVSIENVDTSDIVEPNVSEEALQTHQELLEIIGENNESEPVASQTDAETEVTAIESANKEITTALNIVEIIRAETVLKKEPETIEQIRIEAQDAPPLEQTFAMLSFVLESSPDQPDEPVTKLLEQIAERIIKEPAEASDNNEVSPPEAITPEITQLFINLLEELGYEDAHRTLVAFVSQYGFEELYETALYLYQLAESGDQKEYLTGRLPVIGTDLSNMPLTRLIGKAIIHIVKPEIQTQPIAA